MGNKLDEPPLQFYRDNGYLVVEDLWSEAECLSLVWVCYTFADSGFAPLMQPHRSADSFTRNRFRQAFSNSRIVAIMEQLCGGKVSGLQSVWYHGAPHTPGFNMHQDNYFVEAPPDTFVSAWCAMQDVTPEMGGLVGYPGTHKLGTLPVVTVDRPGSENQDPNATKEEIVLPSGFEGIDLPVPKGAVIFMHQDFIHSSNGNTTDKFRRSLLMTYIRQGSSFRPGNTAKREEVNVY